MSFNETASRFLTFLEEQEVRLLGWGFYNVSFDEVEVENLIENEAPAELRRALDEIRDEGFTTELLLQEMAHTGLLFDIDGLGTSFRTRFAEGVRLIANLRQMFKESDWSSGPRLVSDIKLQLNPRRYPRRDQTVTECWEDMKSVAWKSDIQKAAFEALSQGNDSKALTFAHFQRLAFSRILSRYDAKGLSGSIVTAGTGSGKTKAFYVPAFIGLVTELNPSEPKFTKIIATYPRNVLLADQLREALSEAAKLRPVIERFKLRQVTFGALLGGTPRRDWFELKNGSYYAEKNGWKRVGNGFVVPFLKSPVSPDLDLVWRDQDRLKGSTALFRSGSSDLSPDVPDGVLILTREDLKTNPPDILFLSIEMLNREMGNPEWERTFGFGSKAKKPRLLLLDEVHAYEGVSGAQVAWILRRWRHWTRSRNLHVVGLSATLKDATDHLSLVTGISAANIEQFNPSDDELTLQDVEYNLAVKGDPTSGASLLSTTIQTGMLLTRLLTPSNVPFRQSEEFPGPSFYGRKVFGFTDNLDSLNRWFSDMSDAEKKKRLARLRLHPYHRQPVASVKPAELAARDASGQIWELPRRIGHNLNQSLKVSRCSSQDPGMNAGSDLIIASASLEVGFDDPEVGAVLHHKKPVSISSFIQRKGRAGRRVGTRPWTVTILSDYGADRWAFQNAEYLFQPDIEKIQLPISNPYVLRIQATYFLIDWLGHEIDKGNPFNYLAGRYPYNARPVAREILTDFLKLGPYWKRFKRDFVAVFNRPFGPFGPSLDEAELDAILWREPRPVLWHAVPTLLRKLEREWRFADPSLANQFEEKSVNRPIPKFIPAATFSAIGAGDTELSFPVSEEREPEYLTPARAINETCPGRVSKRYALNVGERGYWLSFSERLLSSEPILKASAREISDDRILLGSVDGLPVYLPMTLELAHRPEEVLDTSNAFWKWESHFSKSTDGRTIFMHLKDPWRKLLFAPEVYLHRDNLSVEVTRFSRQCSYELRFQKGISGRGKLDIGFDREDGSFQPEAIGYRIYADGIAVSLNKDFINALCDEDQDRLARFRPDYYLHAMRRCEFLEQHMNSFLLEWIWQTSLSMLAATSLSKRCTLFEAQRLLKGKRIAAARRVLEEIFQVRNFPSDDAEEESRLKQRILEQWENESVVERIEELESLLWVDLSDDYQNWIRDRFVSTIAEAIKTAATFQSGEVGVDDLAVDTFVAGGETTIFLTETASGGLGQIEYISASIRTNPGQFTDSLRHAISFCPRETRDHHLLRILEKAVKSDTDSRVQSAFRDIRNARGFHQMADAKENLQRVLWKEGLDGSRETFVSLLARLIRPGSTSRTDAFVYLLNRARRKHERRLGVAIDPRTFAYLCVQYQPLMRRLKELFRSIGGGHEPSSGQIYSSLQQFLFEGCSDSCPECIGIKNWFDSRARPSRNLATNFLNLVDPVINVGESESNWYDLLHQTLTSAQRVNLRFSESQLANVTARLQLLLAQELEVGIFYVPISLSAVHRDGDMWNITVEAKSYGIG